jgi:DNA-directed RNA polymerase subunit F
MSEFTIIEENPVTLSNLKAQLKAIEKEGTLSFRGEKTKNYVENFELLSPKDSKKFSDEIKALAIPRLRERHIVKILDILPSDLDSLKILLSGETLTINSEDMKKILDVIPQ